LSTLVVVKFYIRMSAIALIFCISVSSKKRKEKSLR
jgi:hypothetical protein